MCTCLSVRPLSLRAALACILAIPAIASARPVQFFPMGDLPGLPRASSIESLSADGRVAAGFGADFSSYGVRWSPADGISRLPLHPITQQSTAHSISDDGRTFLGTSGSLQPDGFHSLATLWTSDGQVLLGALTGAAGYSEGLRALGGRPRRRGHLWW